MQSQSSEHRSQMEYKALIQGNASCANGDLHWECWDAKKIPSAHIEQYIQVYNEAFDDGNVLDPMRSSDWDALVGHKAGAREGYVVSVKKTAQESEPIAMMLLVHYEQQLLPTDMRTSSGQWVLQALAVEKGAQGLGIGKALLEMAGKIVQNKESEQQYKNTMGKTGGGIGEAAVRLVAMTRQQDSKTQQFYAKCAGRINPKPIVGASGLPMLQVTWSVPKMLYALQKAKGAQSAPASNSKSAAFGHK